MRSLSWVKYRLRIFCMCRMSVFMICVDARDSFPHRERVFLFLLYARAYVCICLSDTELF
jgi:hypothetical protein